MEVDETSAEKVENKVTFADNVLERSSGIRRCGMHATHARVHCSEPFYLSRVHRNGIVNARVSSNRAMFSRLNSRKFTTICKVNAKSENVILFLSVSCNLDK